MRTSGPETRGASPGPTGTLVLLHGTLCDSRLFAAQISHFAANGWRIRTPVVRGHESGMRGLAALILSGLPERFALVGLSLGGIVALEMMRQKPGRITHLALLDTSDAADSDKAFEARDREHMYAREMGLGPFMEKIMLKRYLHPDNLGDKELCATVVDMALDHSLEVWNSQRALLDYRRSSRDVLERCDVPVLVGCGAADTICPPELHREMAKALGIEAAVFEGCGHMSPLEDPAAVNSALGGLLGSGAAARQPVVRSGT